MQFAYDALHRKSRRIVQQREDTTQPWTEVDRLYFLYQGGEEVGSYRETGECTSYRVLAYPEDSALPRTVYMELEGNWYVPQIDTQGSITHLLDPRTAAVACLTRHTAFGEVLSDRFLSKDSSEASVTSVSSPWGYFSKRLDPELGLIDFGRRWYDPQQARWTTLDPAGFIDGTNLYRFVKNNPLLYTDPDGRFAVVIPILSAAGWITTEGVLYALGTAALTYGAYRVGDYFVNDFLNRYERPEEMAWIMGHGPVFSTTTELEPAPPTEGGKDPELNNGPGQSPNEPTLGEFVKQATKTVIKQEISRRARRALVKLLEEDPPNKDAHHIFPRKHRKDFEKRGIDIDNPNYLTFWVTIQIPPIVFQC